MEGRVEKMRYVTMLALACAGAWLARKLLVGFTIGTLETVCRAMTIVSAVRG